ncbi:FAD/NAD(P)-binding protein, partial [Corynebacterium casei]
GVAMNRTQCRTTSDDFLIDPLHVTDSVNQTEGEELEAYLVGAYCIEDELILRRRIRFPHGVKPGDVIAIPNTAGYFMHILESASHQIPLAANVVWPLGEKDDIENSH